MVIPCKEPSDQLPNGGKTRGTMVPKPDGKYMTPPRKEKLPRRIPVPRPPPPKKKNERRRKKQGFPLWGRQPLVSSPTFIFNSARGRNEEKNKNAKPSEALSLACCTREAAQTALKVSTRKAKTEPKPRSPVPGPSLRAVGRPVAFGALRPKKFRGYNI